MSLPDYATWLTPERLAVEETQWVDPSLRTWPIFVGWVEKLIKRETLNSVVEFGCGTGLVPAALPLSLGYVGVDANPHCIKLAESRNEYRHFIVGDVRTVQLVPQFSLVCAFSFFKHFGLHEWDAVVERVLRHGQWGLFSMPVGPVTKDEGQEFPHVWVTEDRLLQAIHWSGHELYERALLPTGENMVVTRQR